MRDLIMLGLQQAYETLLNQIPKYKIETKFINLSAYDVEPIDLLRFMTEHSIPDNATFFSLRGDDGCLLSWSIKVPTTDDDKINFVKNRLYGVAIPKIYKILTSNGYQKIPFVNKPPKQLKNVELYDMFIKKEYDKLVEYYTSLYKLTPP